MYKRPFDFLLSLVLLILLSPFMFFLWILAGFDTGSNGLFIQKRVGQYAQPFWIIKFRTLHKQTSKISSLGSFLRKYKLDELPQIFNVLKGEMSLVGPRPDIEGYYDKLQGNDRLVLQLKPGITGLASLKYKNEEEILAMQKNPLKYNDEKIFPDKVRLNLIYYQRKSFWFDCLILFETVFPFKMVSVMNN